MALYPELIKKVLGRYDLEKGIFEFNFFCDNDLDPRSVCVDCRIPVANSYPCYSNSKTPGELWPALLEKAFAKFYGSFSAISGGSEAIAFTNLTGIPSKTIMSSYDDEKFRDPDALWALIAQLWAEGHILGVTFREVSDEVSGPRGEKTAAGGLISGHAYGVLSVAEVGGNRLLRIRNPHGQTEWTGAWSDGSAEWDANPDVAHQVGYTPGNDGSFFMCAEDLAQTVTKVAACRVFTDRADVSWSGWESRDADEEVCLAAPSESGYSVGEQVVAKWRQNGAWYNATIAEVGSDGGYVVDWEAYSTNDREKTADEVRPRPPVDGGGAPPPGYEWCEY